MSDNFIDLQKLLITHIYVLAIPISILLCFFDQRSRFRSHSLIAIIISALIVLMLILKIGTISFRQWLDFWFSLAITIIFGITLLWMICLERRFQSRLLKVPTVIATAIFVIVSPMLFYDDLQNNLYGIEIKVMLQTEEESAEQSNDGHFAAKWEPDVVKEFEQKFGAKVNIVGVKTNRDDRLEQFLRELRNSEVDVFAIDVVWPEVLANHAEDLKPAFKNDLNKFISAIIDNNTVEERLVAAPWYMDVGLLFYRKDLLEKYGYDNPPETWDELEEMAKYIQEQERKPPTTNEDFWGFVWQGNAYEGLMCNALEWEVSHSGDTITNTSASADITNASVIAFKQAWNWIWSDKISPKAITGYEENQSLDAWKLGSAAFMRHWPYAYYASLEPDSLIQKADIGVTLLPKGNGSNARFASTLGGWQLMVSKRSTKEEKKAAIKFVKFLSKDKQEFLTTLGKLPTLKKLYDNKKAMNRLSFVKDNLQLKKLFTGDSLDKAIVKRPSASTGEKYLKISSTYFTTVHEMLKNKNNFEDIPKIVEALEDKLQPLLSTKP